MNSEDIKSATDTYVKEVKKTYDKRNHNERLNDLRTAFSQLKADAVARGLKSLASVKKVMERANVSKPFLYSDKIKDKQIQKLYFDVKEEIVSFNKNFDDYKIDSSLAKALKSADLNAQRRIEVVEQLKVSRTQLAILIEDKARRKENADKQEEYLYEQTAQHIARAKSVANGIASFSEPVFISPDKHLTKNGTYNFDDDHLKEQAWEKSERELKKALERDLPTRIYMLCGPPCSGKTYWSKSTGIYQTDRHPVVIDATNLTPYSRLKWLSLVNFFLEKRDIVTRAVVFATAGDILLSRNKERDISKRLSDAEVIEKHQGFTWPNLKTEMFDELQVVRNKK